MPPPSPVHELRVALRVDDFDGAVTFYRDGLGLPEIARYDNPDGRVSILGAGRATLELLSADQVGVIDRIEVGRAVSGPVRLALEVADSHATADRLVAAGATHLGGPVLTPWHDRNVRVQAPDGMQLTLFTPAREPDAVNDAVTGGATGGVTDDRAVDSAVEPWLAQAIDLALANVGAGQFPFGAVAVREGVVVATGVNTAVLDNDPTAHAEAAAIRSAALATGGDATGITVFSSAEPCPMCVAVAALVGIDGIVFAAPRALAAQHGFVLPPAAAALGAAWDGGSIARHHPHPRADEPFVTHSARNGTSPS
jgi:lactoylglutathione lyase